MSEHPSLEDLALFVEGMLPDPASLEQHLDTCQQCASEVIAAWQIRSLSLLGVLPPVTSEQRAIQDRVLKELLGRTGKFAPAYRPAAENLDSDVTHDEDPATYSREPQSDEWVGSEDSEYSDDEFAYAEDEGRELAFAMRDATEGTSGLPPGGTRKEINLPGWAAQKLAAAAFGDPKSKVVLFLHMIPRGTNSAQVEVEMRPAPTRGDATLNFRLSDGGECIVLLVVPDETRDDPSETRESIRSAPSGLHPVLAFQFTELVCEPVDDWFRIHLR